MKRSTGLLALALACAAAASLHATRQSRDPRAEVALQAAIKTETIDGDLRKAIELYRALAARKDQPDIAAQALLHMGQCHEKLGDEEARLAYERLLRDFAEQKEAAGQARLRLAALTAQSSLPPGTPTSGRLWTVPPDAVPERVSPDGRHLALTKWNESGTSADIVLHDLRSGADRRITNSTADVGETAENPVFSKDGAQVAYTWYAGTGPNLRAELRVVSITGAGLPQARRLLGDRADLKYAWPFDWSADGQWIAVTLGRRDFTTQIAVVSSADGQVRMSKPAPQGLAALALSPDGRYLAYDERVGESRARDVMVVDADGRVVSAIAHAADDGLVGWTPDGRRLVFTSDRSGSSDLWAQRFENGALQGRPELIKGDVGRFSCLGIGTSGALYYAVDRSRPATEVKTGAFDFREGRWISPPVDSRQFVSESNLTPARNASPDWSPDGRFLAYVLDRGKRGGLNSNPAIVIRSVETNGLREIRPKVDSLMGMIYWAPGTDGFFAGGRSFDGRWGIFRIDARTGEATQVALGAGGGTITFMLGVSADGKRIQYQTTNGVMELDVASGKESRIVAGPAGNFVGETADGAKVYYRQVQADGAKGGVRQIALIERDVASGRERQVFQGPLVEVSPSRLSPDGLFIATLAHDEATSSTSVLLVPTDGGAPRTLMTANEAASGDFAKRVSVLVSWHGWAPDGRSLFVKKFTAANEASETWWLPIDGRPPRRVDMGSAGEVNYVRVHPDGRRVAFPVMSGEPFKGYEVWAAQNLLPKT